MTDDVEHIDNYNRYKIGTTVREYTPSQEEFKHMMYLVAYDVRNPSRLRRVAKLCENYGIRVEYSVFECDLSQNSFSSMWQDLKKEIDPEEDSILAYRMCKSCVNEIVSLGDVTRPDRVLFYFP